MATIRFFGMLRGLAGVESKEYVLSKDISVRELKGLIKRDFPALSDVIESRSILVSINLEFAKDDSIVKDGDEVGFLPPFSGG